MPTNNEVYELVDTATFQGQSVKNVYFFQSDNLLGSGFDADDLIDAFLDDLLPDVLAIQGDEIVHTEVAARSLFDESNRSVRGISEPGALTGLDILPTFVAVGVKLVQDNGAVRNGSKRYPGISEVSQTDGVITETAFLALLDTLATQLSTILSVGLSDIFVPVVVGRIFDSGSYRLPATLAESIIGVVVDGVISALLTSQVSRKIGVGE